MNGRTSAYRRLILLLAIAIAGGTALLFFGITPRSGALLVPSEVDFGILSPGIAIQPSSIRNRSASPVTVYGVKTSCTCGTPELHFPITIEPRSTLHFSIRLDSRREAGTVVRELVWKTNLADDNSSGEFRTLLKAVVKRQGRPVALPSVVDLGRLGSWERRLQNIRIANHGSAELSIVGMPVDSEELTWSLLSASPHSATIVAAAAGSSNSGPHCRRTTIRTSEGDVDVTVKYVRFGSLYMDDDVLVFRAIEGTVLPKRVTLHMDPAIRVEDVAVSLAGGGRISLVNANRLANGIVVADLQLPSPNESSTVTPKGKLLFAPIGNMCDRFEASYVIINTNDSK